MKIRKLLNPLKKYKKSLVFISVTLSVSTVLNLLIPVVTRKMIDDGFLTGDKETVVRLAVLTLALYGTDLLIRLVNENKRIRMSCDLRKSLSCQTFDKLMRLRIRYFDDNNNSELFSSINRDIGNLCRILDSGMLLAVTQILSFIGGTIGLFIVGRELILLVVLFIPAKWFMVSCFAKRQRELTASYIEQERIYAQWFGNVLGGVREIRLFNMESGSRDDFNRRQEMLLEKERKMRFMDTASGNGDMLLTQILVCLIYITGTLAMTGLKLTVGGILAFVSYSVYVMNPIYMLLNIRYMLASILPSAERYYEFMAWDEERECGFPEEAPSGFDIEFRNVRFGYEPGQPVIDGLNLIVEEKEKIAVIGQNGAGKSTLIDLLLRLYECDCGTIRMGGKDIRSIGAEAYRRCFSIVGQEIYLFNGTVRDNIQLDAQLEDGELEKILQECGLQDLSGGGGLDVSVGEKGGMLSGGQRQRIALARAVVRDSPVIILDEANSALDMSAQSVFRKLLEDRWRDKSVLFITHKKDVLYLMDRIVSLERGKVGREARLKEADGPDERKAMIREIGKEL